MRKQARTFFPATLEARRTQRRLLHRRNKQRSGAGVYFEDELGRNAANIAKLPELLRRE